MRCLGSGSAWTACSISAVASRKKVRVTASTSCSLVEARLYSVALEHPSRWASSSRVTEVKPSARMIASAWRSSLRGRS